MPLLQDYNIDYLRESGTYKGIKFVRWPSKADEFHDTVFGALECLSNLYEYIGGIRKSPWATMSEAARWIGLPKSVIMGRCVAAYRGYTELWPWTELGYLGSEGIGVFIPELWEEVQWVTKKDAAEFVGVRVRLFENYKRVVEGEKKFRYFRGTEKIRAGFRPNTMFVGDVLRHASLFKLRGCFGKRCSYETLEPLLELSHVSIARLKLRGLG